MSSLKKTCISRDAISQALRRVSGKRRKARGDQKTANVREQAFAGQRQQPRPDRFFSEKSERRTTQNKVKKKREVPGTRST